MIKIREQFIPINELKRPGTKMEPGWLTIHSTANLNSTAQNERNNLAKESNTRKASFHLVVDEKECIQCIPFNEIAFHAGDGKGNGNMKSIALEICESGNRTKTLSNAAEVAAQILLKYNWNINKMVQHNHWSGKNCPRILRVGNEWQKFINLVKKEIEKIMLEKSNILFKRGNKEFKVEGYMIDNKTYIGARELLEQLGFVVGWDNTKKQIIIK